MSTRDPRLAKLTTLAEQGATEGEREAALAALDRVNAAERQRTAETERLLGFGYRGPVEPEPAPTPLALSDDKGFADTAASYDDQGFAA